VFGLESGSRMTSLMWFTPYAVIAGVLVAGVAVALRNWVAAAVTAVATVALATAVLPRTVGSETVRTKGHETVPILSANIERGSADPTALVELVDRHRPDLLSVQELTPSFVRKLRRAGIDHRLPHSVLMARPRGRGGGLYARHPLVLLRHQTQ